MNTNSNKANANQNLPKPMTRFFTYMSIMNGKSQNTIDGYKSDLCLFFRFIKMTRESIIINDFKEEFSSIDISDIDAKYIDSITYMEMTDFITFLVNTRNNKEKARARKISSLKSLYLYLQTKEESITNNPTLKLNMPKIEKRKPIYIDESESKNMLMAMNKEDYNYARDYCILTILLNCAIRREEVRKINMTDIRDDQLRIIGKGNKERFVPLTKSCKYAINNWLSVRTIRNIKSKNDKDALFISRNGNRISNQAVGNIVIKYRSGANIDKVRESKLTTHKMRHSSATMIYRHNGDIRSLQRILGHKNILTTQIYTHVNDEDIRKAVNSNPLSDFMVENDI